MPSKQLPARKAKTAAVASIAAGIAAARSRKRSGHRKRRRARANIARDDDNRAIAWRERPGTIYGNSEDANNGLTTIELNSKIDVFIKLTNERITKLQHEKNEANKKIKKLVKMLNAGSHHSVGLALDNEWLVHRVEELEKALGVHPPSNGLSELQKMVKHDSLFQKMCENTTLEPDEVPGAVSLKSEPVVHPKVETQDVKVKMEIEDGRFVD